MKEAKHPRLGVTVREDGAVFLEGNNNRWKPHWTYGSKNKEGYFCVKIKGKKYKVHRLIAEAFIQNENNYPTVDHIDRNPENNNVSNLRWADLFMQQENAKRHLSRDKRITVLQKDDPNGYRRQYNALHREENRKYQREYYRRKKEAA